MCKYAVEMMIPNESFEGFKTRVLSILFEGQSPRLERHLRLCTNGYQSASFVTSSQTI